MITETLNTTELFNSLDKTWDELLQLISSANAETINSVPFTNSWTIAQLVTHVTKSNKAIIQAMNMEGKPTERDPEAGAANLKGIFLNFETKFQSPEFIIPENKQYNKEEVIMTFKNSIDKLKILRNTVNLTELINLPIFGDITKLEILHFVLYHTQRHIHQLKGIIKKIG